MKTALSLLACLGILGAFDTLYYHEWRARLPARSALTGRELRLHAWRDFVYAILFGTLPWLAWHGAWALLLAALLVAEILITLADFIVEDKVRAPFGGVFPGERATHGIMAIVYGAMLANLVPVIGLWWRQPTALVHSPAPVLSELRLALAVMAAGVFLSGVRDLASAKGIPRSSWPWEREA
ncbi:MAG TPA: hypothetical protein VJ921_03460 [Vicinamibacteria bacterium]|nr:hypothetical protein [Vicinamibacteria bacterium]